MAAITETKQYYLSSSPHFSGRFTTRTIMLCVIGALILPAATGIVLFGAPAAITIATSVISCVIFEALFQKLTHQKITINDCSAIVTGLMLACVLPPSLPIWMTILGALFGIVVAKGFFGGIGSNVFNPALTGRAFLFVSFPAAMGSWTAPFDGVSSATLLAGDTITKGNLSYLDLFLGNRAGCIGETGALFILAAFVFLLALHIIDWRAPVAMIAVVAATSLLAGHDVLTALMSGGVLFGAVFMTTDYATTPQTKAGRLLFGAGCGLITFLIRQFGGYPEGVMYSILIMNILTPFLNKLISRRYGAAKGRAHK